MGAEIEAASSIATKIRNIVGQQRLLHARLLLAPHLEESPEERLAAALAHISEVPIPGPFDENCRCPGGQA